MNWLDIAFLCLAAVGIVKGLFDGVIKQVVSLMALCAAIYFCSQAAAWLRGHILALGWFPPEGATLLSYLAGFLLIMGAILLAGEVVDRVVGATPLGVLNHIGGGVAGLCFMAGFVSLVLNVLEGVDRGSVLIPRQAKVESRYYDTIKGIVPTIYPGKLFWGKDGQ